MSHTHTHQYAFVKIQHVNTNPGLNTTMQRKATCFAICTCVTSFGQTCAANRPNRHLGIHAAWRSFGGWLTVECNQPSNDFQWKSLYKGIYLHIYIYLHYGPTCGKPVGWLNQCSFHRVVPGSQLMRNVLHFLVVHHQIWLYTNISANIWGSNWKTRSEGVKGQIRQTNTQKHGNRFPKFGT